MKQWGLIKLRTIFLIGWYVTWVIAIAGESITIDPETLKGIKGNAGFPGIPGRPGQDGLQGMKGNTGILYPIHIFQWKFNSLSI